jgi:hypothetical protein
MLQPIRRQGRLSLSVSLLALLAVAIAVLVSVSLTHTLTGPQTGPAATEQVQAVRPIVGTPAERTACAPGAYVSGDMAGNSSPAEIYGAQCPDR